MDLLRLLMECPRLAGPWTYDEERRDAGDDVPERVSEAVAEVAVHAHGHVGLDRRKSVAVGLPVREGPQAAVVLEGARRLDEPAQDAHGEEVE